MPTIKCHNDRVEKGKIIKCDRFLVSVPDCAIESLRNNPGEEIICRCPSCPPYQRWTAVYYDGERKQLAWRSITKPRKADLENEQSFELIQNSQQVG